MRKPLKRPVIAAVISCADGPAQRNPETSGGVSDDFHARAAPRGRHQFPPGLLPPSSVPPPARGSFCPDRDSAASAGENFASIMNTRFARVSRLKITGGVSTVAAFWRKPPSVNSRCQFAALCRDAATLLSISLPPPPAVPAARAACCSPKDSPRSTDNRAERSA